MAKYVLAFDVYGTLIDTSGIAQTLSSVLGLDSAKASEISALWRRYQLEYTWRMNSMAMYEPFDIVTQRALVHALKDSDIEYTKESTNRLMDAYNVLPCFPNTILALQKLSNNENVKIVVFSNGTLDMVQKALDAAHLSHLTPNIYVADAVRRYKPTPEIYQGLLKAVEKEEYPGECFLISGNPFDVLGAVSQGIRAIWVDRARKGWTDSMLPECPHLNDLVDKLKPFITVNDLEEISDTLSRFTGA